LPVELEKLVFENFLDCVAWEMMKEEAEELERKKQSRGQ